jgi:hypothetical protein
MHIEYSVNGMEEKVERLSKGQTKVRGDTHPRPQLSTRGHADWAAGDPQRSRGSSRSLGRKFRCAMGDYDGNPLACATS